ncbi:MAG: 5'/3'-nucleotidase SurE [Candidatus Omnitrophota bacterium]
MRILLTNDDGIRAAGLRALVEGLSREGHEILVAAPANERSASSHAITLGGHLKIEELSPPPRAEFSVHGTPADCVKFALAEISGFKPDLIISGINQGANTGVSVFYSGTISAAREGTINRIPSAAISLCSKESSDFSVGVEIARRIIEACQKGLLSAEVMLNVNIPALPSKAIRGIRVTKQASSRFIEEFIYGKTTGFERLYTLAGEIEIWDPDGTSDHEAIENDYISITPLKIDLTEYSSFDTLRQFFSI